MEREIKGAPDGVLQHLYMGCHHKDILQQKGVGAPRAGAPICSWETAESHSWPHCRQHRVSQHPAGSTAYGLVYKGKRDTCNTSAVSEVSLTCKKNCSRTGQVRTKQKTGSIS